MSIFASQFDRARVYTGIYTGPADDTTWRTPRGAAGGGLLAVGVVSALAAGGIAVGLAAAATVDAFFDSDPGTGHDPDSHADPHPGHGGVMAHAHTVPDSAPSHEASGVEPASSSATEAGGGHSGAHADSWGANWGDGWEHGWDAESSHRLATSGHVDAAAFHTGARGVGDTPDQGHDDPGHGGFGDGASGHDSPVHDDLGHHTFFHGGAGHDQQILGGHADTWVHDPGHLDAAFGDDGHSSFHGGVS